MKATATLERNGRTLRVGATYDSFGNHWRIVRFLAENRVEVTRASVDGREPWDVGLPYVWHVSSMDHMPEAKDTQ